MSHFYLTCPSIKKIKEKKRNINNNLVDLPSHNTTPLLSFLIPRNFPTIRSMGQPCHPSRLHLPPSILGVPIFLLWLPFSLGLSSLAPFLRVFCPSIVSNFFPFFPSILGRIVCPTIHATSSLWTFLEVLLVGMFLLHTLAMPHPPYPADILSRILQLLLLRSLNSHFFPKCLTPP